MRGFLFALVVVIIAIAGGSYLLKAGPKNEEYFTGSVEKRTIVEAVSATGSASPIDVVYVQSEIIGVVDEVLVTYNDEVEQGQVLARINSDIPRVKLEAALAGLEAAERAVEAARAGIETARSMERVSQAELDAARRLYEDAETGFEQNPPLIPKAKLDAHRELLNKAEAGLAVAQSQVNTATSNAEAAGAKVEAARVEIKAATLELSKAELKAPVAGTILNVNCQLGDTVGRPKFALSEPSPALFEVARPLERMQAVVRVNEVDYSRVKSGQRAKFTIDAYPDDEFEAKVVQVRNSATSDRTAVTYDTVIEFDNRRDPQTGEWMIRPRATCRADILVRSVEDVLAVPNDALFFSPPANEVTIPRLEPGESLVWVVSSGKRIEPRKVFTGITDGYWTEVVSGEVKDGEQVVVGQPASKEGLSIPTFGG